MGKLSSRDRGAVIALITVLIAIVAIAWFGKPIKGSVTAVDANAEEQYENGDIAHLVAALREFNPWQDTYAQWLMAALGFVASGISVWAVIEVRKSLALTRVATSAATSANSISKELFAAENRPWLRLGRPAIRVNDEGNDIVFEVKAFNIGKTPALSAEVHVSVTRTKMPVGSVAAVENFASKFTAASAWKNNQKVIFPEKSRTLRPMDDTHIGVGEQNNYVRVIYCVTYRASGLERTLRTAGEVLFHPAKVNGSDNIEGDWFLVEKFHSYGVAVAD